MKEILLIAVVVLIIQQLLTRLGGVKTREISYPLVLGTLALFIFLRPILGDEWKLSFTNLMYAKDPFQQSSIQWFGRILSDPVDAFLPFINELFVDKNVVFWSSQSIFGVPILSKFILNPLNLSYLFGLELGQVLYFIMKYTIAFIGMYSFLKVIGQKVNASYVGAITYTFSSAIVVWGGWPHSDVIAFAPILFYAIEKLIQIYHQKSGKNKIKYYIVFCVVLYLMLIFGMPTYVAYFMYLGIAYTIFRITVLFNWKKDFKFIFRFLISIGITVVVAALMSMPYIGELYGQVSEYASTRGNHSNAKLPLEYILGAVLPYYKGETNMALNESSIYVGVFLVIMSVGIPLMIKRMKGSKRVEIIFWSCSAVILILFIFTSSSGIIYQFIPLINSSLKYRVIAALNFVCAVLASYFIGFLEKENKINVCYLVVPILTSLFLRIGEDKQEWFQAEMLIWTMAIVIIIISAVKNKRYFFIALMLLITCDMSSFARQYLPLLEKSAPIVPTENESIKYLQENTTSGERIIPIGMWNLFAASNMFYDLNSVSGHVFVNTNEDVKTYIQSMDDTGYTTSTRTAFNKIDNFPLLSYASVKYLYQIPSPEYLSILSEQLGKKGLSRVPMPYDGSTTWKQEFINDSEYFTKLTLLLSTGGGALSQNDSVTFRIYNENDQAIYDRTFNLGVIEDNRFFSLSLDEIQENSIGKKYYLEIEANTKFERPLIFWITDGDFYSGELNNNTEVGDIVMLIDDNNQYPNDVQSRLNGETLELKKYSSRAFVANNFIVNETEDEILEQMKQDYIPNTAFMTADIGKKYNFEKRNLGQEDDSNIVSGFEDNQDYISMKVTTTGNNMLVLNDYYYPGWKAYIDGEEVSIEKVNYLFRGIYLEEPGTYTVEFKYLPTKLIIEYIIWVSVITLLILVFIFRKKINRKLDKIIQYN